MYRRLWGGTDLSFTLHCLFGCFFGKLALPSNRVNVKPACPKLGILYRPAAACSISLERLAPVVLLLLLLVRQGTASLEWGLGGWPGRADNGRSRFVLPILLTQRVASSASASCRLNRFAPPTTSQTRGTLSEDHGRLCGDGRGSPCFDGNLGAPSRPGSAV